MLIQNQVHLLGHIYKLRYDKTDQTKAYMINWMQNRIKQQEELWNKSILFTNSAFRENRYKMFYR